MRELTQADLESRNSTVSHGYSCEVSRPFELAATRCSASSVPSSRAARKRIVIAPNIVLLTPARQENFAGQDALIANLSTIGRTGFRLNLNCTSTLQFDCAMIEKRIRGSVPPGWSYVRCINKMKVSVEL
jgi:hypothetical protein